MVKNIINKIFFSIPFYDIKQTKFNIIKYIFLSLIVIIIFSIVLYEDLKNPQTFISNDIKDSIEIPKITIYTENFEIFRFSINYLNITQDPNLINYENLYICDAQNPIISSICINEEKKGGYFNMNGSKTNQNLFYIENFNLTYQENFMNINFLSQFKQDNVPIDFGWYLYIGNLVYMFVGPVNVQVLFTKEIFTDSIGNSIATLKPTVLSSLINNYYCTDYFKNNSITPNCFSSTISIFYEENIVNIYSDETRSYLVLRILKNTFSISFIVTILFSILFSFLITKLFFKKSKFENSIRDSVLYHFNNYLVEKGETFRNQLNINNNQNSIDSDDKTMGSKIMIKRLFQDLDFQDSYSKSLSLFSKVQYLVMVLILLGISIFIITKDLQTNTIITKYIDYNQLELPEFNFTFKSPNSSSVNFNWEYWMETLPNDIYKDCYYNYTINQSYNCSSNLNDISLYPNKTVSVDYPSLVYANINANSISLQRGQSYSLIIETTEYYQIFEKDLVYIELQFNNVTYYLKPFTEVDIQLTKTILYQNDGNIIIFYDPTFLIKPFDKLNYNNYSKSLLYDNNDNDIYFSESGFNNFTFSYSSYAVKEIYQKSYLQILIKIVTDISAFVSPVIILITFLFTQILIKLIYKNPSAHVEFEIRESIIFYLNNYKKYKSIFKKSINTDNNLNLTFQE